MRYPQFPQSGDNIGIFAPSAGVGHKLESFDASLDTLRNQGYFIQETASVRVNGNQSANGSIRGAELSELIQNKSISAILSASGGDFALEMLPYVDFELIQKNPKWIAGASDPTNLLYPITTNLDIATLYGFNAGTFDWRPLHPFQENMLHILRGDIISQHSFDFYDASRDFSGENILDTPVYWESRIQGEPREVSFSGRIIGGCIDCIAKLLGTPYDGTAKFVDRYEEEGILWYFDPFAMDAETLYLTLLQMKYCGYFRGTTGILFGRVMFSGSSSDAEYMDLISRCFDVPIVWNCDIGHVKPCMTLINGAVGHVHVKDGVGTIEMELL